MVAVPPAVIFVNNDLTAQVQDYLATQLFIDIILSGAQFDALIAADPEYHTKAKQANQRILVIRSFYELTNRDKADVVIFIKEGLAAVETTKFGPPATTYPVANLTLGQLGLY
jgi:hypothetical protein